MQRFELILNHLTWCWWHQLGTPRALNKATDPSFLWSEVVLILSSSTIYPQRHSLQNIYLNSWAWENLSNRKKYFRVQKTLEALLSGILQNPKTTQLGKGYSEILNRTLVDYLLGIGLLEITSPSSESTGEKSSSAESLTYKKTTPGLGLKVKENLAFALS